MCVPDWFGEKAVSCVGHRQWVGSRGLCNLPRAAENRLLPLSSVSLMKVENFWLLNRSCGCWKRLCLKCRSSWRPVGLRKAVEKNVCLTVTRFAYSTMFWEGRLTRGKKINLCVYSEPSEQLRFSDQLAFLAAREPDFTSLPVALLYSLAFDGYLIPTPIGRNFSLLPG